MCIRNLFCWLLLSLPLSASVDFSIHPWYTAPVPHPIWVAVKPNTVKLPKYPISKPARDLIVEFEVTSREWYIRKLVHPEWPGGSSGITIGIGYDLGYSTKSRVVKDWYMLPESDVLRLQEVTGISGTRARSLLTSVRNIIVPWESANEVFDNTTLMEEALLTVRTFPGAAELRPNAFGALVSLIYNRGSSLVGDSRREMRTIKTLVPSKDYDGIAAELRSMQRIWRGKDIGPGLIRRRESEAKLVETP